MDDEVKKLRKGLTDIKGVDRKVKFLIIISLEHIKD